jgi:hypothetical protein
VLATRAVVSHPPVMVSTTEKGRNMARKPPNDVDDGAVSSPAVLSEPCGFCLNEFHDLCPRSISRSGRADAGRLGCPCAVCEDAKGPALHTDDLPVPATADDGDLADDQTQAA